MDPYGSLWISHGFATYIADGYPMDTRTFVMDALMDALWMPTIYPLDPYGFLMHSPYIPYGCPNGYLMDALYIPYGCPSDISRIYTL